MAHTKLRTYHLFAGAGGGILADILLGHIPVGACEIEQYPRDVLLARQRDGIFPIFPIWDDICTLDGKPWRGLVDVVCGGFPCQDISAAGKGEGIGGERSGLWGEMARVIREMRPRYAFVENSPMLTSRGLGTVLGDLAAMGYDAKWCVLGACDAGAPHKRDRIWILATDPHQNGCDSRDTRESGCEREALGSTLPFSKLGCADLRESARSPRSPTIAGVTQQGGAKRNKLATLAHRINEASASSDSQGRSDAMGNERRILESPRPASEKQPSSELSDALRPECESRAGRRGVREGDSPLADANSSRGDEDSSDRKLRADRVEQSSADSRVTDQTEGREVTGWWDIDPAESSDSSSEGLERQERQEYKGDGDGRSELCIPEGRKGPAKPLVGRVANGVANILDGNETPFAGRVPRVATGVTDRVSRLKAIGNGQVPQCAALAWRILTQSSAPSNK